MTARTERTSQHATPPPQRPLERPLRRDAERNRQRILAAAAEVFAQRGLDATLDEVARAAEVGVGTVYRRFPDKESLVAALFRDSIDALVTVAEDACDDPDPWHALVTYLEFTARALAGDLGLRELMMFGQYDREQVCCARDRMRPVIGTLVERAQAAGVLREDFEVGDVKMISLMLASVADYASSVAPDAWRRYLALFLDGLRPSRAGTGPLPAPAPTAAQLGELMQACSRRPASGR